MKLSAISGKNILDGGNPARPESCFMEPTFIAYASRVFRRAFQDAIASGREQVLGIVITLAILYYQVKFGLIAQGQISANVWALFYPYLYLFAAFAIYHLIIAPWRLDQERQAQASNAAASRANLDIRFSQSEPYRFKEREYLITHYRIGAYNEGPVVADHVEVLLRDITPRPRGGFKSDLPYFALPTTGDKRDPARRINPKLEEFFELLSFGVSSADPTRLFVNGLDTKVNLPFEMYADESWVLEYVVSSANSQSIPLSFRADRVGDEIALIRL